MSRSVMVSAPTGGSTAVGRGPWVATALLTLALALFGARWHWVEQVGSAERDGFVTQAEAVLAGELPRDPYRPPLYALLSAAATPLTGSAFASARLLSNLSAAALALLAFALTLRLTAGGSVEAWGEVPARWRRGASWGAWALVAMHPSIWTLGQHVATDAWFAALATACLLAALAFVQRPSMRRALGVGALYGLAAFSRGSALFLLPALVMAWGLASVGGRAPRGEGTSWRRRGAWLAAGIVAAVVVLLPRWILSRLAFGDPFHDLNYRNLAWKLYGYPDWSKLESLPFGSLGEVIAADPSKVVEGAVAELMRFATEGGAALFGTQVHWALVAVAAVGALASWRRWPTGAWLAGAAMIFLGAVATAFFAWGRLLLLLLPVGFALLTALGARWGPILIERALPLRGAKRSLGSSPAPALLAHLLPALALTALVVLLALKTFAFRLPVFIAEHPYDEVALLRQLEADAGAGAQVALAGTTPFLDRYVESRYVYLPDAFGADVEESSRWFDTVREMLEAGSVGWLVTGPLDLRQRPASLLEDDAPVPWLAPGPKLGRARSWRVIGGAGELVREGRRAADTEVEDSSPRQALPSSNF